MSRWSSGRDRRELGQRITASAAGAPHRAPEILDLRPRAWEQKQRPPLAIIFVLKNEDWWATLDSNQ